MIPFNPLEVTFDAKFSPTVLPKNERAPVTLVVGSALRTRNGTPLSALEELTLAFDRTASINVTGLPICEPPGRGKPTMAQIKKVCRDAIVGGGQAGFQVAFPDQAPVASMVNLTIFNGTDKGITTLYAVGQMMEPVSTNIVMPVEIRRSPKGRLGTKAIVSVPKVANGSAALTDLDLTLYRRIPGRATKVGIISLKCPEGKFSVFFRGTFVDGSVMAGDVLRRCFAGSAK